MNKIKPCTLGPKHKWVWKRNVTLKRIYVMPRGTTAQLSYRGEYRCECGQRKYGASKDLTPEDLAAATA